MNFNVCVCVMGHCVIAPCTLVSRRLSWNSSLSTSSFPFFVCFIHIKPRPFSLRRHKTNVSLSIHALLHHRCCCGSFAFQFERWFDIWYDRSKSSLSNTHTHTHTISYTYFHAHTFLHTRMRKYQHSSVCVCATDVPKDLRWTEKVCRPGIISSQS